MTKIADAASEFLSNRRVAVTGVSRSSDHAANTVYKRLREQGYEVFAINPNVTEVEDDTAYPNLAAIPDGVEAVVIGTAPAHARATVQECIDLGIKHVWMHRGPGGGSVDPEAARYGRENGLVMIDGGCPCMFGETSDLVHRIMRPIMQMTGSVPRKIQTGGR
ncbi:MAG: CoA-binding protein [Actinomycetia bacterium]|nr:CoA-binding protein [Actinomycetes bacterium]MCP4962313.1 CoA-binding protein [Actinomycetes bacterium]